MNLNELVEQFLHQLHPFESISSSILFIGFLLCTFIQIAPIKINPWDILLGWIGERFNSGMNKKMDSIDQKVKVMELQMEEEKLKATRRYIIGFVNEGVNGKRHTKESFEDVIKACDAYEVFIKKHNISNGVINSSMHAIRSKYEEHLINADFATSEHYIKEE